MNIAAEKTTNSALKTRDITRVFPLGGKNSVTALNKVSLEVPAEKFSVFIGPSGCGKSTLMNILGTIDRPTTGEIEVSGKNALSMSDAELALFRAQEIGFIFQVFNLIPVLNVFDNVAYPLRICKVDKSEIKGRVMELLKAVGMDTFHYHRPNELSGGQRQRVAIARALVMKPSLVLADEPTANLDSKTSVQILDLMRKLCDESKVTFVFCTHDNLILEYADYIFKMKDGQVLERKKIK